MSDQREILTEEVPETPEDFKRRRLTETGEPSDQQVLTEDLPDAKTGAKTLLG